MSTNLSTFIFTASAWGAIAEKSWPNPRSRLFPVRFLQEFRVSWLLFASFSVNVSVWGWVSAWFQSFARGRLVLPAPVSPSCCSVTLAGSPCLWKIIPLCVQEPDSGLPSFPLVCMSELSAHTSHGERILKYPFWKKSSFLLVLWMWAAWDNSVFI